MNRVSIGDLSTELRNASGEQARCYLLGASRDGTFNRLHKTVRIAQADIRWLRVLKLLFLKLGSKSWIYREGARRVWVIETACRLGHGRPLESMQEQTAFVRGYFDAEGGIPRKPADRFYIQIAQENRADLEHVRWILSVHGIRCGEIHNPSVRADPNYWRFYVLACSQLDFIRRVGSWHPRKRPLLKARMKLAHLAEKGFRKDRRSTRGGTPLFPSSIAFTADLVFVPY